MKEKIKLEEMKLKEKEMEVKKRISREKKNQ